LSGDVSPLSIFVPVLDDRSDDVADDLERTFRGADERPGLLAHGHDLHLRLAALGDGDGLAALGDLVDQRKALCLEGGGVDLPVHGPVPM
jgi:hypothetical protein